MRRRVSAGVWFLLPGVIFLLALTLLPFANLLISSFQNYYLPKAEMRYFVGLQNYLSVLKDPIFRISVIQTLKYISFTIGVEVSLGFAIALLLNANSVLFKKVWRSLLIIPMMITPTIASFFFFYLFNENYGYVNNLLKSIGMKGLPWFSNPDFAFLVVSIVEIWMWTPFVALMILAGLQALREDIYEAAQIEGANNFQLLRYLTFPMIKNTLIVASILKFIWTLKVFDSVAVITRGGPGYATYFLGYLIYNRGFQFFKIGEASAMAVLFLISVGIIARFIFNRISIQE